MKTTDTLDQPEEKQLSGLDEIINCYRVIQSEPELLILREKHTTISWQVGVAIGVTLFVLSIYFGVLAPAGKKLVPEDFITSAAVAGFGAVIWGYCLFRLRSKRARWTFTDEALVITNDFGRKNVIPRSDIVSVFLENTTHNHKGTADFFFLSVKLRTTGKSRYPNSCIDLLHVKETDTLSEAQTANYKGELRTSGNDGLRIATIIAEYWGIPVRV